jgi:hypothetical protein
MQAYRFDIITYGAEDAEYQYIQQKPSKDSVKARFML